jgi:addiction module HigA family antidote
MPNVAYPHPGEILGEEFLSPMDITRYRLAKEIGVPQRRIDEIVSGNRAITADTALRLSRYFGMSDVFWLNLQAGYDARVTKHAMANALDAIRPVDLPAKLAGAAKAATGNVTVKASNVRIAQSTYSLARRAATGSIVKNKAKSATGKRA